MKEVPNYETIDQMDKLLIPPFFQYKLQQGEPPPKITQLREWQYGLLSRSEWKAKHSCVVVSPTSGGKTLIAEIAMAQILDDNPHAMIIYTLPFVALAMEKYEDLCQRFSAFDVRPFFQSLGGEFKSGSIAVCTYEKAHSLVNQAILGNFFEKIKLIVIDEVHMIGDENRGIVPESLLMKLMAMPEHPRIVALTATLNEEDAKKLASCMNGFYHICEKRNVEIKKYISNSDGSIYQIEKEKCQKLIVTKSIPQDHDRILPLIRPVLARDNGSSILVFVNTRYEAKSIAVLIAKYINESIAGVPVIKEAAEATILLRKKIITELSKCSTGLDPNLGLCVQKGVAFHHAGLLIEERKIIEEGIRLGGISIIVATTTLSAGINIQSVSRVIIHSAYRRVGTRKEHLSTAVLTQMSGRAGRKDGSSGDVVVISRNNMEMTEICKLFNAPIPGISSSINKPKIIDSFVLQAIFVGIINSIGSIEEYIRSSFAYHNIQSDEPAKLTEKIINNLTSQKLLNLKMFTVTNFGAAIAAANLSVEEGLRIDSIMLKAMKTLCLSDNVHLLFICIPNQTGIIMPAFTEDVWEVIFNEHQNVINLITGKTEQELRKIIIASYNGYQLRENEKKEFEWLYAACILKTLINEADLQSIEKKFAVDRGAIQVLQNNAASFAGQATKFAEERGYILLSAILVKFRKRLEFAVKEDILPLVEIPSVTRDIARKLYECGYTCSRSIIESPFNKLFEIIKDVKSGDKSLTLIDIQEISKNIYRQAKQMSSHKAILEDFDELATIQQSLKVVT